MVVSRFIKKLPIISKIVSRRNSKLEKLNNRIDQIEEENRILYRNLIDLRLKLKKNNNEKINVVFVCHRPAIWESLHSVYDAMQQDKAFNVTIVAIPNKKELPNKWFNHEEYESEGAEEFWKEYGCINGYNYDTKQWFDLKKLNPDYVFFQQPYNITRCPEYKSQVVSRYANICYVAYAGNFIGNGILEETTPVDYINNVSVFFTQNEIDDKLVRSYLNKINNNFTDIVLTGFPRNDSIISHKAKDVDLWKNKQDKKRFRVLWTPRWCTNEGNCNFFQYKDLLASHMANNDAYDFVFRPHPQAFTNWISSGEMTITQLDEYERLYVDSTNMDIDKNFDYLDTIYTSDCLISDVSSFIQDYFITGKPIIYCHNKDCFNEFSREMAKGFYWVENFEQLVNTLEMLKKGDDPLKEKRLEILKKLFTLDGLSSDKIKNYLKNSTIERI